jgi:nitroreductase
MGEIEIHPLLRDRRSPRHFNGIPPEPEKLQALIEAFRWAPSSGNKQPWRLIIVRGPAAHAKFPEGLSESNRMWAPAAPIKIIVVGNPEEQPSRFGQDRWLLDCGLALENLLLQANALGLAVHGMGNWDEETIRKNYNIPDPFRVAALVAVGYPGRVEDLVEEVQKKETAPRTRKPMEEIVFWDEFGKPGKP